MIQIFSNSLGDEELAAVAAVFRSRWLGRGRECDAFEAEFAAHLGVPRDHVLLTNACTSAIYIALEALEIGPGDEVIVSTGNFVACASAIVDRGATPVFADVDPRTLNLLPSEIDRLTTPRTRAVFLLHYGGHPCSMADIRAACRPGVLLLEDSANAVASSLEGRMCGTFGDAGVFSFDAMKTLVMADGGALVLPDEAARRRAASLRYLGLAPKTTSGMDSMQEKKTRWWEYDLDRTSGRFISNDVLAAIARVQLRRLPSFLERRAQVWRAYQQQLEGIDGLVTPPEPPAEAVVAHYLYWVQTARRDELAAFLAEHDVYTTYRYYPLHLVNRFRQAERLPNAEHANEITLNLPLHQNLSDHDIDRIIGLVRRFFTA